MFSPGSLNAQAKTQSPGGQTLSLGGVSSHAALADDCTACHAVPLSAETMAGRCLGCHQDVQQEISSGTGLHGGLVAHGWSGTSCGGCHPEHRGATGALTVLDKSFPHDMVGFSLRAHSGEVGCQDCHPGDLKTFDTKTCAACHEQMDQAFMTQHTATFGQECVPCHDGVDRYGQNFDHNKLAFPLTGGHAGVECGACHTDMTSVEALQNTPQDCYSCHAKDDAHAGKYGTDCGSCHTPNGWSEVTFDHSVFPLDHGSQEQVATCKTCHPDTVKTYTCLGCHAHTAANVVAQHEGAPLDQLQDCIRCHPGGRRGD